MEIPPQSQANPEPRLVQKMTRLARHEKGSDSQVRDPSSLSTDQAQEQPVVPQGERPSLSLSTHHPDVHPSHASERHAVEKETADSAEQETADAEV